MLSLSHVCLFATLWTIAPLALLSIGFSRQEYWSGLQFLLQTIFLTQGSNLHLLHCKRILYLLSHLGSPKEWQRGREFYVINTKRDSESIPWAESKGSGESVVEGKQGRQIKTQVCRRQGWPSKHDSHFFQHSISRLWENAVSYMTNIIFPQLEVGSGMLGRGQGHTHSDTGNDREPCFPVQPSLSQDILQPPCLFPRFQNTEME